ncbi:hypothetical protein DL93DRAFT_2075465 [Clavulina sp. PMI_390]|nr:hypothetical protein DL93DRAFT_2075465 [Clavulina sp. PMI_390]
MGSSGASHHPMQVEEPEDDVETDVRHRGIGGGHNVMQFGAINGVLGGRLYNYDEDKEDRFEEDGDDIDLDDDDDEEEIAYSALNPRPPKIIGAPLVQAPQALADLGRSRSPATSRKSSSAGAPASAASPSTSKPGGETPPPPRPQTELEKNDNTLGKPEQAAPTPGGDKPSDAVKMEGLMDGHKAEDPLGN